MSDSKGIEVSKLMFWAITSIGGAVLLGFSAWIHSTNTALNELQIDMATIMVSVNNLDRRVESYLNITNQVNRLSADVQLLNNRVDRHDKILENNEGVRFDLRDYEKYIKPPIDSLLERVTRLENKQRDMYE